MVEPVPAHLHFIWIGAQLPWFAKLAIQSALTHEWRARATLWATHDLSADPQLRELRVHPRFELASLDERTLFADAPSVLPLDLLAELFRTLTQPAARANIARLLVLARFGGVYLDTDTITLRSLSSLSSHGAFCGLEHVVWPLQYRGSKLARALGGAARELVRAACARAPHGERAFSRVAGWYQTAANNAVLGFRAGHPFLLEALHRVAQLSPEERKVRYRLGTHLLQEMLARAGERLGVKQLPPPTFYPLGPELSRQYFRPRVDAERAAHGIVSAQTYVIHWYASVSELAPYDEARVFRERERTVFAQLSARAIEGWNRAGRAR